MRILDYQVLKYVKDKNYSAVIFIYEDIQRRFGITMNDIDQELMLKIMSIPNVWRPVGWGTTKSK